MTETDRLRLFIGRYTVGDDSSQPAPGITVALFDPDKLTIEPVGGGDLPEASFVTLSTNKDVLYAVREEELGGVAAFALNAETNALTPLGTPQPTHGSYPCHLSVSADGRHLLSANYMSGNVAVHPIAADGSLGEATAIVQHEGTGPNAERQDGPHAHMVLPAKTGDALLAVDLGTDSVYAYDLDGASGQLTQRAQNRTRPGNGPRHLVFHPSGDYFYLANELSNSVGVYAYDAADGTAKELAEVPAAPDPQGGESFPAGIVLSPDARFVYVANRGDESISGFEVRDDGARLEPAGRWSCGGSWPRHIALTPDGRFMFIANQRSHNVVVLRVDPASGALEPTRLAYPVKQVAHVLFG
ncbi:MAG: lactonase family protein [Actinocrinis sp.]